MATSIVCFHKCCATGFSAEPTVHVMADGGAEEAGECGDEEDDGDRGADGSTRESSGGAGRLNPVYCEVHV